MASNTTSSATTAGQASKGSTFKSVAGNLIGGILEGSAKGLGVSDGGLGQTIKNISTPRQQYTPSHDTNQTPMPSSMRMMVQEQMKIPPPEEIEQATRDLENDPKLPEDGSINTAYNRLHDHVHEGFVAITDTIQHNFHLVEQRFTEQSRAINVLSTEQQKNKRSIEDLEQRFGRLERGGLQSRSNSFSPSSMGGTVDSRPWGSSQGGSANILESLGEAALGKWVTDKLLPAITRNLPMLSRLGGIGGLALNLIDLQSKMDKFVAETPKGTWGDKWNQIKEDYGSFTSQFPTVDQYNKNRPGRNNRSSLQTHQQEEGRPDALGLSGSGSSNIDDRRGQAPWTGNSNEGRGKPVFFTGGQPNEKGPIQLNADQAIITEGNKNVQIKADKTDIKGSTLTINSDKIELSERAKKSLLEALGIGGRALSAVGSTVAGGLSTVVGGLSGAPNPGGYFGGDQMGAQLGLNDVGGQRQENFMGRVASAFNSVGSAIGGGINNGMTNHPNHAIGGFNSGMSRRPDGMGGYANAPGSSKGWHGGGSGGGGSGGYVGGGRVGGSGAPGSGTWSGGSGRPGGQSALRDDGLHGIQRATPDNMKPLQLLTEELKQPAASKDMNALGQMRAGHISELRNDPAVKRQVMQMMATEGNALQAGESLFNRVGTTGVTLKEELNSGFYGPMNSGQGQRRQLTAGEERQFNDAIDKIGQGSNSIQGRNNQGAAGDKGAGNPGRLVVPGTGQEIFNYWTGQRRGKEFGFGASEAFAKRANEAALRPGDERPWEGSIRSGEAVPVPGQNRPPPDGRGGRSSFSLPVPEASGIKPGQQFPQGSERLFHEGGKMEGVDPRLTHVMREASRDLPEGHRVQILSGHDGRTTGTTNHPQGFAYDVAIYDAQGKMIPHNSDTRGWNNYEKLARSANIRSQSMYPGNEMIWGGAWVGNASGTGDQEHFQFRHSSGSQGSGEYSFDKGLAPNAAIRRAGAVPLSPEERNAYDAQVRQRMASEQQQTSQTPQNPTQTQQDPSKPYPAGQTTRPPVGVPPSPGQQKPPDGVGARMGADGEPLMPNGQPYPQVRTAPSGKPPDAFIMHHTSDRHSVQQTADIWRTTKPGVGSQFFTDREGNVSDVRQATGYGGSGHMLPGDNPSRSYNQLRRQGVNYTNQNTVGLENSALNNKDITEAQIRSNQIFMQLRYPNTPVYGHGEFQTNRESDEAMRVVQAIRDQRQSGQSAIPQGGTAPLSEVQTPYAEGWDKNSIAKKGWEPSPSPMPDWYKPGNRHGPRPGAGTEKPTGGDTGPVTSGKYSGASGSGQKAEPEILSQSNKYSGANKFGAIPPARDISAPAKETVSEKAPVNPGAAPEGWHKTDSTQHPDVKQKWADVDKGASTGKSGADRVKPHGGASVRDRATHKSGKAKPTTSHGGGKETSSGHNQHGSKHGGGGGGKQGGQGIQGAPANHPESSGPQPGDDGIGFDKVNGDYSKGGLCMV